MGDAPPRVRRRKWDEEAEPTQAPPTARVNKWDQPALVPSGGAVGVSAALVARTQQGAAAIVEKINQVRPGIAAVPPPGACRTALARGCTCTATGRRRRRPSGCLQVPGIGYTPRWGQPIHPCAMPGLGVAATHAGACRVAAGTVN